MSAKDRVNVFPSRANFVLMKARVQAAAKGHSLLKRKRDALDMKVRELVAERKKAEQNTNELMAEALFSMAKGRFLDTDFKPAPILCIERADAYMTLTYTKTMGLQLPTFEPIIRKSTSLPLTGLSKGGAHVEVIRDKFQEVLKNYLSLASVDYSLQVLQNGLRVTNMRMNGLEFVVLPRLQGTVKYIRDELDEFEREEFYRLKCSQAKQRSKRMRKEIAEKGGVSDKEVQTVITGRYPSSDSLGWYSAIMSTRDIATQYPSFLFSFEERPNVSNRTYRELSEEPSDA